MGDSSPSTKTVPTDYVPTTFSEMFEHYYHYVRGLVIKSGIDYQNAEDVAMDILTKFYEKDVLNDFNPTYSAKHTVDFSSGRAMFRTFLSGFVLIYVRHYRQRQNLDRVREPLYINTPVVTTAQGLSVTCMQEWGDLDGRLVFEDDHSEWYSEDLVKSIRSRLATAPVNPRCSLQDLFEACLRQADERGKTDVADLAIELEVGRTTLRTRLSDLRGLVDEVFQS